jgi:hypothetical protein
MALQSLSSPDSAGLTPPSVMPESDLLIEAMLTYISLMFTPTTIVAC